MPLNYVVVRNNTSKSRLGRVIKTFIVPLGISTVAVVMKVCIKIYLFSLQRKTPGR